MENTPNTRRWFKQYFSIAVLSIAIIFFLYDIIMDLIAGSDPSIHIIVESLIFFATSYIVIHEILRVIRLKKALKQEQTKVARLSGNLAEVIERDFETWALTNTEKEVALLLIKGLSMIEIGELRGVKEKTVRQQATNIYLKSKCANRHELAAKFIEDLLNI